jgi:hypothetical protein
MAAVKLVHGTIVGPKCPHCPLICQKLISANPYEQPPTVAGGVASHVELVHPEHYQAWLTVNGAGKS